MNFPQFWALGKSGDFFVWRWSSQSLAEAQTLADAAARQIAERFKDGIYPRKPGGYYPDRPFREQIMQEIRNSAGEISAVITRNSYGCLVLNTARVMFVDIDLPEPKKPRSGIFQRLFGKPQVALAVDPAGDAILRVENWTRNNPDWGWRVYRTRSGLRLLATQGLVDANSDTANRIFDALGADPLYRKLCNSQKCFRARLTPKPWRCGLRRVPARWPWLNEKQQKRFQKWEANYQSCSGEWATCEFVRQIGNSRVHSEVQQIIKIHDEPTRSESKLPLA